MSVAPAALAMLTASVTMLAAPRPEPARPARNRIPATTGADLAVLIVVSNGDRPRRSTCLPAILVCPNDALFGVPVHRPQQRIDVHERPLSNAVQHGRPVGQGEQ